MNLRCMLGCAVAASSMMVAIPAAAASYLPYGPQNDVALSTVINDWGWTQIYRGSSEASVPISTLFAGAGTYIMYGAILRGSQTIDLLAATTLAEATQYTAINTPHVSNGANWYYNDYSIGFAGVDDRIYQNTADYGDEKYGNCSGICERDRMSWHTAGSATGSPTVVYSGWRTGNNYLYGNWDRVVFTTNSVTSGVPEPGAWALMLLGFGFVGGAMRSVKRRQRIAVSYA